ncbi:hypothetical protein C0J52_08854 [Blattella germanica]|nr:hypothetical protein C0J52_08854 [Blattella germanica]
MTTSPSVVLKSGDSSLAKNAMSGDPVIQEESEDESDLPQCKIKRNYTCTHCTYYTQNPRSYLYHLKDEHGEKIKVYECPSCLYASKHSQKLQRHVHMVHVIGRGASGTKKKKSDAAKAKAAAEGAKVSKKTSEVPKPVNNSENSSVKMGGDIQECSVCSFTSSNPSDVLKHERTAHLKKKFYRCSKCNYVTHMKARYTKHVKYHSMPMIKCDLCDFRTPYKWNLDRHYKNHTGDGAYRCALCNFTADIKQSLTVHEMNHHVPPVGQPATGGGAGAARRRNKVGASDSTAMEEEIDQEELELLRMEREDAADSAPPYQPLDAESVNGTPNNINNKTTSVIGDGVTITSNGTVNNRINSSGSRLAATGITRRTPKIKVTLKKMKAPSTQEQNERHNFQTDFIHPDDIIHHKNGNVYIKNLKCQLCNFKAAWEGEMTRHESKVHGMHRPVVVKPPPKKVPRPIPNLIPIQNRVTSPGASGSSASLPILRIPSIRGRAPSSVLKSQPQSSPTESGLSERDLNEICAKSCPNSSLKDFASVIGGEDAFRIPDDETETTVPKKSSPKPQEEEEEFMDDEDATPNKVQQEESKPENSSPPTDLTFKKKNASFFDKLKEKLLVGAGESCNLVCTWCGHESKCLSELARHQKLHTGSGNRGSEGNSGNGNSGLILSSAAELSSTRCQHCRQRCKTSADLVIHLQSCTEANRNLATSPVPTTENKEEKMEIVEDEEEEEEGEEEEEEEEDGEEEEEEEEDKTKEEEPHPMENKVFVWNNLPQPVETESEEDHQSQSQLPSQQQKQQTQQEPPPLQQAPHLLQQEHPSQQNKQQEHLHLQQLKQTPPPPPLQQMVLHHQDEDSMDTSVRSKSPISDGSLVGIETAPGYGAVTRKIPPETQDGSTPNVFKCPHCSFWASTASRFHVHIVGHLNKKPFECSLCAYRSNWRWDITKHIRLKSARDAGHERARVLMTDETGRRNYSKYNKYLTLMRVHEPTAESSGSGRRSKVVESSQGMAMHPTNVSVPPQHQLPALPPLTRAPMPAMNHLPRLEPGAPMRPPPPLQAAHHVVFPGPPPLQPQPGALLQKQLQQQKQQQQQEDFDFKYRRALKRPSEGDQENNADGRPPAKRPSTDSKKTLWKCKKCNYRDASRELVLAHVKEHYQQRLQQSASGGGVGNNDSAEASVRRGHAPFRCGHCHQVSNWKHVIQRHCRLKHSGDVRVVIGLKEGGTVEERFMIDDGNSEAESNLPGTEKSDDQDGIAACDKCPYSSDSTVELEAHKEQHFPRPGAIFKCYFCPFYVVFKRDLLHHMRLHGVSEPEDYISKTMQGKILKTTPVKSENRTDEPIGRQHHNIETSPHKRYKCVGCPYVSNSKSQFLYHKQFHRPRGAPFKCGLCSYNVSRRHLLHQHLRVHGILIPPQKSPTKSSDREVEEVRDDGDDEIEEVTVISQRTFASPVVNEPVLDTHLMTDIPLVWVCRANKFSKMFKCRFCPHVNLRKANIQEHEKMHRVRHIERDSNKDKQSKEHGGTGGHQQPLQQHRCPDCNYVCNNAGVLSSHAKVHQGLYGQVHCLVDTTRSDEAQLQELNASINRDSGDESGIIDNKEQDIREDSVDFQLDTSSKSSINGNLFSGGESILATQLTKDMKPEEDNMRMLYFCKHCPARFLFEKELNIHIRFHEIRLAHRCESCSYTARQRPHLLAHLKVHTDEYQEKTSTLISMYKTSLEHPRPRTAVIVEGPGVSGPVWVVIGGGEPCPPEASVDKETIPSEIPAPPVKAVAKQYSCELCPAKFFKSVALQYHVTLHGGSGPHKCRRCDYAVKTYGNLVKHEMIHEGMAPKEHISTPSGRTKSSGTIPLSGTELFQQKSEAQKQSHNEALAKKNIPEPPPPPLHVDPQFGILMHGSPDFIYPTYFKNGRLKEKRYKCHKCPSAFEKREQYKVHLSLHGSRQRYKCEKCDYSVKYYANYIQHMRKHQSNEEAIEARKLEKTAKDGVVPNKEERMDAEVADESSPLEEDIPPLAPKSVKTIGSSPTSRHGPLQLSMADRQTILLLQQRRSSNASSSRDGGDERKCFRCPHCPYSSHRRDGVESHVKRHLCVSGVQGAYICSHCDYTVPQLHFLREHNKIHFKNTQPEIFMKCERMELWTMEEGKENISITPDGPLTNGLASPSKSLVFQDNGSALTMEARFIPVLPPELKEDDGDMTEKVFIDLRTGEPLCETKKDENEEVVPEGEEGQEHDQDGGDDDDNDNDDNDDDEDDDLNNDEKVIILYNENENENDDNENEVQEEIKGENSDSEEVNVGSAESNADDSKSESGSSSSSSSDSSSNSSSDSTSSNSNSSSSNSSNSSSSNSNSSSSSSSSGDSDSDESDDNARAVKSAEECTSTCSEN